MVAQLVEDLLHLERGEDRLDEDGRADRPLRQAERVLGEHERVVPEPRLEVALELRQVEVRPGPGLQLPLGRVEHVEAEVEETCGHRLAVDGDVLLAEVPAARADEQRRDLVVQPVLLLAGVERDRPLDGIDQVRLALDAVRPRGRVRVLEVGHEDLRARVERVDHHLAVDGPRDLDATILEVGRRRGYTPVRVIADVLRLGKEVGQLAGVDSPLPLVPPLEQLCAARPQLPLQRGDELERLRREDALSRIAGVCEQIHTRWEHLRHTRTLTRVGLPRAFSEAVAAALPADAVLTNHEELRTYECDGLTGRRVIPRLVCLPETTEQVQIVVRACAAHGIPFVARGAGTGLSGGALPVAEGIVISLARMNRVLDIDLDNQRVVVQPGVTNLQVTEAVAADGFYYAPDPSSQQVCTIGGNLAENSGGAHCLKYGFTVNHVLGAVVVLPNGEVVTLSADDPGPDLLGVFVGSEGTLGIATEVTLRVLRRPERVVTLLAAFDSTDAAGVAVSAIIGARILPSAIEMMDRLTIEAAEAGVGAGYPEGANAVLIVELDGVTVQVEEDLASVEAICLDAGSFEIRVAADDAERALLWLGRKSAFAAMGRISESYYVQDGVVPRTKLPEVLREIARLEAEHGLRVGNVFHAGDGNLHPLVLYDDRVRGRGRAGSRARRRDPRRMCGRRRLDHRRARRGDGQGMLDAAALLGG